MKQHPPTARGRRERKKDASSALFRGWFSHFLLLVAQALPAAVELRVGETFAVPGGTTLVPIRFTSDTNIVAVQLDLVFGTANFTSGDAVAGSALADHVVTSGDSDPGIRRVVIYSPANATLNQGVLVTIPLTLATNTPYGAFPLILSNVLLANYDSASVTNFLRIAGGVTCTSSIPAIPLILTQPISQAVEVRANATLSAIALGIEPLSFQWRRNGTVLPGMNDATLSLTRLQPASAGAYTVVVSNAFGSVTSQVATLAVNTVFARNTSSAISNSFMAGAGIGWADHDGDNDLDVYVAGYGGYANQLFRNDGNGLFALDTTNVLSSDNAQGMGVAWGDYDNDGRIDVFVGHRNGVNDALYHNLGGGGFAAVSGSPVTSDGADTFAGVWGDYDRDGWLDLFVARRAGPPHFLYHNNADGTFTSVNNLLTSDSTAAIAPWWFDYDNDGWPDLFLAAHDGQPNALFHNLGQGNFAKVTSGDLVTALVHGGNCALADYDNDGFTDLFIADFISRSARLYHNNGDGTFTRITNGPIANMSADAAGATWGDFDNDGFLDLFVATQQAEDDLLFRNNGDGTFASWTNTILTADNAWSVGAAWADHDRDGDLDLMVSRNVTVPTVLYDNLGNSNSWLELRCLTTSGRRDAIGARIQAIAQFNGGLRSQHREIFSGYGVSGNNGLIAHFGLGDATNIDVLCIKWPSGTVQTFSNVVPRQMLVVTELAPHITPTNNRVIAGSGINLRVTNDFPAGTVFQWLFNGTNLAGATNSLHRVANFSTAHLGSYQLVISNAAVFAITAAWSPVLASEATDFIPVASEPFASDAAHSSGVAWGDFDGDGHEDLFISNIAAGFGPPSFLYRNNGNGTFTKITSGPLVTDNRRGNGASWGDYDNDGDLDLAQARDANNGNSVYRNDGAGMFVDVTAGAIGTSSGNFVTLSWGDYNRDGFLDLAMVNAGGVNFLYRNNRDGTFSTITNSPFTAYPSTGGSATWVDYDNDQWLDLFASNRDAKNALFRNGGNGNFTRITNGNLVNDMAAFSGAAWGDYDNNGSPDVFITVYAGGQPDFLYRNDGNGGFTRITNGSIVSLIHDAISANWADYDNDGFLDLLLGGQSNPGVSGATYLYHNNGDGTFAVVAAGPVVAEAKAVRGTAWADYDNDGFLDLYIAHSYNQGNSLFRNAGNANGWLKVKLKGSTSNRSAIGAKVRVSAAYRGASRWQLREVSAGVGYQSQNSLIQHFGLGDATNIATVRVEWPSGRVTERQNVAPNQMLTFEEPVEVYVANLGNGTVTVSPATNLYFPGQTLTLAATPRNTNWTRFLRWSDGNTNVTRSYSVGLSNSLTAIFTNSVGLEDMLLPQWQSVFGGTNQDSARVLASAGDGGWLLAGLSHSPPSGNKTAADRTDGGGNTGDAWVLNVDGSGNMRSERAYGGSRRDYFTAILNLTDGGRLFIGNSRSPTNVIFCCDDSEDYWVLRTDSAGNELWQRAFGTPFDDNVHSLAGTPDGGFLIAGYTHQPPNGFGGTDAWLIRLDGTGQRVWDRPFGGANSESVGPHALCATPDGGFILGATSDSPPGGNKTAQQIGSRDLWLVKLSATGDREWDKTHGGLLDDWLVALQPTRDGGFVVLARSFSLPGVPPVTRTAPYHGSSDLWVMKLRADGSKEWDQSLGGSGEDGGSHVLETEDGGFLVGGYSASLPDGNKTSPRYGDFDYWLIKLDANGVKRWDHSFGGTQDDVLQDMQFVAGAVTLLGSSSSGVSGTKTSPAFDSAGDFYALGLHVHSAPVGTPVVRANGVFASNHVFNSTAAVTLTMTSAWNGPIHFTTDGSEPSLNTALYDPQSAPQVVPPATVKAIAYLDDLYTQTALYVDYSEVVTTTLEHLAVYTVNASTPGGGTVAVTPPAGSFTSNSVVTISATNLPGWIFLGWAGDLNSTNPVVSLTLTSNITAQALFGTALTTNTIGLGSIARTPALPLYPFGTTVRLTALPAGGRFLSSWGGALSGAISPRDLIVTNANPLVTATFGTIIGTNFGLVVQVIGEGTISYFPATNRFGSNAVVTLTAAPKPGWTFAGWSGASNSTLNPLFLVMNTNKSMTAIFNPPCVSSPSQIVAWWRGENDARDVFSSNDGTIQNGVSFAPGKVGAAFDLDGVNDYISLPSGGSYYPGTNSFTLQAWILRRPGPSEARIITLYECTGAACGEGQLEFGVAPNGNLYCYLGDSANNQWLDGATRVDDGLFHHVAVVRDLEAMQLRLFVDGRLDTNAPLLVAGAISDDDGEVDPVLLGAGLTSGIGGPIISFFNGLIDELVMFHRSLASNELLSIYTAGSGGMCAPTFTNVPPTVTLTNPPNGAIFTAPATITSSAHAHDNDGTITSVRFYSGTNLLATSTNEPFTFAWNGVGVGSYSLTAVATDNSGLSATSIPPASITVNAPNQPPLVSISTPTNGSIFPVGTNLTITASAVDPDGSVTWVEFFAGTNLLGADGASPFAFTWSNVAAGTYSLTARATDNLGAVSESAAIGIVVSTVATNPPVFSWSNTFVEISEAAGSITLHVFKSPDSAAIPADIGFHPQSASADTADFGPVSGQLNFAVGETVKPITVPIIQDTLVESNHFFFMVLDPPAIGSINHFSEARITILDDDIAGTNSVLTKVSPSALPSPLATLRVDLQPTNVGQWRFVWENTWHDGGAPITGLPPGNYEVQFKPVSGYIEPLATYVPVVAETLNVHTFVYSNTVAPQLGSLVVLINPSVVATNGDPQQRGQWRRGGESTWRDGGTTVDALPAGSHVIEFKPLTAGSWQTPSSREVTVQPNQINTALGEYFVANPTPGVGPTLLQFSTQVQNPFGFQRGYQFCGQLLTPLGWGSGTVVKQKVVLTAAHVVFDDYALAYVPHSAVKWFFQRQAGEYEPAPQTPRGWVVSSSYAAQREAEAAPGLSGTASRDVDLAALYFGDPAGRGGFSGYLVSRPGEEWLHIATSATLAGYPLEGIPAQNRGKMHRTVDQEVTWNNVSNQVYATTDIKSFPGNSGGPILVQLSTNVNYWPAAVYLGGSGDTVVRAIDALAVVLINTAEILGNAGANNTGGEPPRQPCLTCPPPGIYGYLDVHLAPTNVSALGGGYRFANVTNGVVHRDAYIRFQVLGNTPVSFNFVPVPFFIAPAPVTVSVASGRTNSVIAAYKSWGQVQLLRGGLQIVGSSNTVYRLESSPRIGPDAVWTPVRLVTNNAAGVVLTNLPISPSNTFIRAVLVP